MIKLEDAYFGIMVPSSNNKEEILLPENLFNSSRVLRAVATWKTKSKEATDGHDQLAWCFGDTRGRCEYEWIVSSWPKKEGKTKVDVYRMYVEPNRELLLGIVDNISVSSCKKWLREHKR